MTLGLGRMTMAQSAALQADGNIVVEIAMWRLPGVSSRGRLPR
jgi:hypothetical protein